MEPRRKLNLFFVSVPLCTSVVSKSASCRKDIPSNRAGLSMHTVVSISLLTLEPLKQMSVQGPYVSKHGVAGKELQFMHYIWETLLITLSIYIYTPIMVTYFKFLNSNPV